MVPGGSEEQAIMSNVGKVKGERMIAPRPLLTKKQKVKIGNLMLALPCGEIPIDFESSAAMRAMFKYIKHLIQAERRYWEKRRGLR